MNTSLYWCLIIGTIGSMERNCWSRCRQLGSLKTKLIYKRPWLRCNCTACFQEKAKTMSLERVFGKRKETQHSSVTGDRRVSHTTEAVNQSTETHSRWTEEGAEGGQGPVFYTFIHLKTRTPAFPSGEILLSTAVHQTTKQILCPLTKRGRASHLYST